MSEISKFRNEKKLVDDELLKILETDNNDNYLDDLLLKEKTSNV